MALQFSLAPVLEQRRALEDKAQREYAAALERIQHARRKREQIEEDLAQRKRQVLEAQQHGIRYLQRELIENWIQVLQQQLLDMERELHRLAAQAEPLRLKLIKAM